MKWVNLLLIATAVVLLSHSTSCSRILGVFPMASRSHWSVCSSVVKILMEAGHEVTVISPFNLSNTTVHNSIEVVEMMELFQSFNSQLDINHWMSKIAVLPAVSLAAMGNVMVPLFMENRDVQAFLQDHQSNAFDLVIVEAFATDALFGFGEHFNAPVIAISTNEPSRMINYLVENPEQPSYMPNVLLGYSEQMSLGQRLKNYLMSICQHLLVDLVAMPLQSELHRKYFPGNTKSLREIVKEDVALVFVNTHFSLAFPRPYVPNMIEIGGVNINTTVRKLPSDLQMFLDSAKEGVVLFSMGSIVQASDFTVEQRQAVINALGKLKQKVIWRYNLPDGEKLPKNIWTRQWLLQKDILAHPNVKLFITHGGMLGTTESIYHGKPMIGIPIFGDQHVNINRAVDKGFALKLDLHNLTESGISAAIQEILNNRSYTERAQEISKIYKDQPLTPQELVLYWSEYVIRHKGAKHMQVQSQNLGFFAYHGLDVFLILLLTLVLFVMIPNYLIVKWIIKKFRKGSQKKNDGKLKRK